VDGGFLVPVESREPVNTVFKTGENIEIDLEKNRIRSADTKKEVQLNPLGDVLPIIEAGGLFQYARKSGMIAS
jgi:3-isopropylmalate/(R)-2-methylmalate dehydratase small subunit